MTADLVFEPYLVLCMLGDPLLTPALDQDEIGCGEIEGYTWAGYRPTSVR